MSNAAMGAPLTERKTVCRQASASIGIVDHDHELEWLAHHRRCWFKDIHIVHVDNVEQFSIIFTHNSALICIHSYLRIAAAALTLLFVVMLAACTCTHASERAIATAAAVATKTSSENASACSAT